MGILKRLNLTSKRQGRQRENNQRVQKINDSLTISDNDLEIQVTHSDFIGQLKPPSSLVILNDGLQIQGQRQVWWFARYVWWPVQNTVPLTDV